MMKNKIIAGVFALLLIIGGIAFTYRSLHNNVQTTTEKDATYTIEMQPVTLINGLSSVPVAPGSASMVTTQYFGNEAVGDLNGDGIADKAFILTQSGGGSGTFYYIVAALKVENGYSGTNGVLLGDRIAPQTLEVKDGKIVVNYADRKAGDSMSTAPSIGVSRYFKLSGNQLVELER